MNDREIQDTEIANITDTAMAFFSILTRRRLGISHSEEEIHKRAGSFFERLWQYDQVVFDASKTIIAVEM